MTRNAESVQKTRERVRDRFQKVGILFINAAEFFGPPLQDHRLIMKYLDPHVYRVFVATNRRGDSIPHYRSLKNVVTWEYNLGGTFREKQGLWQNVVQLFINIPAALSFLKILRLVRKEKIDLIHCASAPQMVLHGTLLSLFSGAKLVVHVHQESQVSSRLRRFVMTLGLRRADAVIAVSHFIKERVASADIDSSRTWVVWNTRNLERFHPRVNGMKIRREYAIETQAPIIATVGRITPDKGQRYLLEALPFVKQAVPDVRTLLVGWEDPVKMPRGNTYQQELREFCAQHSLADTVVFTGPRADANEVFAAADVVVVPSSYDDPCPLVVIEAMASGKPIIGTESGGIPEMLGDTGVLVPKGSPEELAEAIIRLLKDPMLRHRLGQNARKRAEQYFYESRLAEEAERVYASVLQRYA